LRVSVVATGIEADEARMPTNVEQFRPRAKAAGPLPARPGAHPVHSQVEVIAHELNATVLAKAAPAPMPEPVVAIEEAPALVSDPLVAAQEAARVHALPSPPMRPVSEREEPRRRRGLFGIRWEKKREPMRAEPQISAAQPPESRAPVQAMRNAPPQQRATNAPPANADDLFPDFKEEDQFEIPAFLRRQTN
jgi:hypothetical protein